jgi:xanthine dioxygenase
MTIETVPLTLPPSADPSKFSNFGRQVIGVDPGHLSPSEFVEIQHLLYKVPKYKHVFLVLKCALGIFSDFIPFQYDALLFRNVNLTPEQQYALTRVQSIILT